MSHDCELVERALSRIEREVRLNWGSPSVSERVLLHVLDARREPVSAAPSIPGEDANA